MICVDLTHPSYQVAEGEGITFRAADLTEHAEALDLAAEFDPDAVVHFAAYPAPTRHADGRVFETNAMSTYHTLVAAGRADARVVWASSESTYGFPFAREQTLPEFLPITEDHPLRPEDPYGASKVVGENYPDRPTADAIGECFGDLPEECALEGEESAFSTEKARDLLGWEPKHHWRTAAEDSVSVSLTAD